MLSKEITIGIPSGLEARPIAMLVQVASQYESEIYLDCGSKHVNVKSIMGMMTLALSAGDTVEIITDGPDEKAAMKGIEDYLING